MRTTAAGLGVHQNYKAKREIRLGIAECPELSNAHVLRRWTRTAEWTEFAVPVAGPNTQH